MAAWSRTAHGDRGVVAELLLNLLSEVLMLGSSRWMTSDSQLFGETNAVHQDHVLETLVSLGSRMMLMNGASPVPVASRYRAYRQEGADDNVPAASGSPTPVTRLQLLETRRERAVRHLDA